MSLAINRSKSFSIFFSAYGTSLALQNFVSQSWFTVKSASTSFNVPRSELKTSSYSNKIYFNFSSAVTISLTLFLSSNMSYFNLSNLNISLPNKFGPFVSATINETFQL